MPRHPTPPTQLSTATPNPTKVISNFHDDFDEKSLLVAIKNLPKSKLTDKPILHFVHANGFVGECYTPLFEIWEKYFTVVAIMRFGMNPDYSINNDWLGLTDEVSDSIAQACKTHGVPSLVAVGHSVGGMTSLQATLRNNPHISQLVALDPPLLMGRTSLLWYLAKMIDKNNNNHAMMDTISPSKLSKRRRDVFDSREQAYDNFRDKGLFKGFDERAFRGYIDFGMTDLPTADNPNQVTLTISREAEVAIFRNIPTWTWYKKPTTNTPINLVVGDVSHFTDMGSYMLAEQVLGLNVWYHKGSHMFPLEQPSSVATLVLAIIAQQIV